MVVSVRDAYEIRSEHHLLGRTPDDAQAAYFFQRPVSCSPPPDAFLEGPQLHVPLVSRCIPCPVWFYIRVACTARRSDPVFFFLFSWDFLITLTESDLLVHRDNTSVHHCTSPTISRGKTLRGAARRLRRHARARGGETSVAGTGLLLAAGNRADPGARLAAVGIPEERTAGNC